VSRNLKVALTGNEHLSSGTLVHKRRGISVDGAELGGVDGTTFVNGLANNVDDAAESLGTDGNHDGVSSVGDGLSTDKTLSGVHSDGADVVSTQMLGDLEDEHLVSLVNLQGIQNGGKGALEPNVDDSTNNLGNLSVGRGKAAYTVGSQLPRFKEFKAGVGRATYGWLQVLKACLNEIL
jgi:hypothetical protein